MRLFSDMEEVHKRAMANIRDFRKNFPPSEIEPLPGQRQPNDEEFVAFVGQMVMDSRPMLWVHQKTGEQVYGSAWLLGGTALTDMTGKKRKFIEGRDKDVRRWQRMQERQGGSNGLSA